MKLVHSSPHSAQEHLLKNVIESAGIACELRNESLAAVVGEVPAIQSWVELWVMNDDQLDAAQRLLASGELSAGAVSEEWCCAKCGEQLEGQFTACWQCGESRPGLSANGPDD